MNKQNVQFGFILLFLFLLVAFTSYTTYAIIKTNSIDDSYTTNIFGILILTLLFAISVLRYKKLFLNFQFKNSRHFRLIKIALYVIAGIISLLIDLIFDNIEFDATELLPISLVIIILLIAKRKLVFAVKGRKNLFVDSFITGISCLTIYLSMLLVFNFITNSYKINSVLDLFGNFLQFIPKLGARLILYLPIILLTSIIFALVHKSKAIDDSDILDSAI